MLLFGRKLLPCTVIVSPGATVALPLSERPGAQTVRPRPMKRERMIRAAAEIIAPTVRQPVEPPVDPPVDPPGEPPGCPGGVCGGWYGGWPG